ncbi:ATP-dependent exoDNAse (exonuclease V) beta subunit (contains helicase and exonuclease domains) [Alteromonadaceae bacterium Bs31]|nr:ATP-dependent exoDNAse (exonuclease V) beta subunit (contains helicase and exonuclease domains) [Alteromonadaceae bacterium Bs31]
MIAPDALQREQALDAEQSFICEAPAGSGKTELLIQRYLTLLARVEKPEEILAITFTRKATGEMRERILVALQSALQEKPQEAHKLLTWNLARAALERDTFYNWQLLQNPNRLQIKTFDSLCASLARYLPLESSLGAMPQVSENSEQLYRQAVQALLDNLEDDLPWSDALAEVLYLLDNRFDKFANMMVQLLAKREQWLPLMANATERNQIRQQLEHNLQSVVKDNLRSLRALIPQNLHLEIVRLAAFAASNLRAMGEESLICSCLDMDIPSATLPGFSPGDIPLWLGIDAMLTTKDGKWRSRISKSEGFPVGENKQEKQNFKQCKQQLQTLIAELKNIEGLNQALANLRKLPLTELDREQWTILDALFSVLPMLSAHLNVVFQKNNCVDFIELNLAAQRALGQLEEPTQLALKLDYQLKHILVDEFQDTSHTQVSLLNLLTAGWQIDDGRSLFCVGDAMQSIYAFRGANVGLFLNCREKGLQNIALNPLRLSANFRSQKGIVDWINRVFQHAFPQQNDIGTGAVSYAPSHAVLAKLEDKAVCVHGFIDRQEKQDEAENILDIIVKTRADKPEASIALLLRNRGHASHITPALKKAGLPYRAVELEPLQDHAVIQDLIALTRALLHPADRTAWLAVLRAPWCGLSLADLDALANYRKENNNFFPTLLAQAEKILQSDNDNEPQQQSDLFNATDLAGALSPDGQARLQRILPSLSLACINRERKTLRDWIEGCWLKLAGPACVEDATALENAEVFFKLLEQWEYAADLPGLDELEQAIAKLYATPDPNADEKLQIMTIHKSKGLEFDVVILPSLERTARSNESSLLMWRERLSAEGENELLMAPYTQTKDSNKHPTYEHLRYEEKKAQDYENCRLLYVACTRAKKQLHLSAFLKENPKDQQELKAPSSSSLLATIWEAIQIDIKRYHSDTTETAEENNDSSPRLLHRLESAWQGPTIETPSHLDAYIPHYQYGAEENTVKLEWQSNTARITGTVIHYYLQLMAQQGLQNWSAEKIQQQLSIEAALRLHGIARPELKSATEKVRATLLSVLHSEHGKTLLSNDYSFSKSEYALSMYSGEKLINLVIDRTFTDNNNVTWVVDYKTAEPGEHEALQDFLEAQKGIYENKMQLYKKAMSLKGFSTIVSALYFPGIDSLSPYEH